MENQQTGIWEKVIVIGRHTEPISYVTKNGSTIWWSWHHLLEGPLNMQEEKGQVKAHSKQLPEKSASLGWYKTHLYNMQTFFLMAKIAVLRISNPNDSNIQTIFTHVNINVYTKRDWCHTQEKSNKKEYIAMLIPILYLQLSTVMNSLSLTTNTTSFSQKVDHFNQTLAWHYRIYQAFMLTCK